MEGDYTLYAHINKPTILHKSSTIPKDYLPIITYLSCHTFPLDSWYRLHPVLVVVCGKQDIDSAALFSKRTASAVHLVHLDKKHSP